MMPQVEQSATVTTALPPRFTTAYRLKSAVAAALMAGLALSPRLWFSNRWYPLTPVLEWLKPIPHPLDTVLYGAMLALLAAIFVMRRPRALIAALVLIAAGLALFDQSRLQPWFYQYLLMLMAIGLSRSDAEDCSALDTCRLIVAATYLWSGLQKSNGNFADGVFPWMIDPFTAHLPIEMRTLLNAFGMVAPLVEIAIGIGLLTKDLRDFAVIAAIGMHGFILLSLGPLGHNSNSVVWPWNIAMICFVLILYWREPAIEFRDILLGRNSRFHKLVLLFFVIAPALSFFNLWDHYLSSALYAGNRNSARIYVTDSMADRLPDAIQQHTTVEAGSEMDEIELYEWSMGELNVPPYPEPRIYRNIARHLCAYAQKSSDVTLVIQRRRVLAGGGDSVYTCATLGVR